MTADKETYPASFDVEYPDRLDRFTTFFRLLWSIPILFILFLLTGSDGEGTNDTGKDAAAGGGGLGLGLVIATALIIVFRQHYPKWWYDFSLELNRFSSRVIAYLLLLTDRYPSTVDKQSVHLEIAYPNVKRDLNRWLPLIKWLLAVPHYLVLLVLLIFVLIGTVFAWFAILFTGTYPRGLFNFVVGVGRWGTRVNAYAFMLTTDKYPPFSLK